MAVSSVNRKLLLLLAVGVAVGGWWYWSSAANAQSGGGKPKADSAVVVRSVVALRRDVPASLAVSGFVTPVKTVDIRSQVVATVQRIHVREGQQVTTGQSLFSLDDRGVTADSEKLAAQVVKDQAAVVDAQRTLARNKELLARNFIAQSVVDSAQSALEGAQAALKADRAALASGRVAVDYRHLISPITGRVGEIKVHLGSLVQPSGADALTTVTQMDPINVTFNIPERHVRSLLAEQRAGSVAVAVKVGEEKLDGKLSFVDNAIDTTAGSIKARAVFANPQAILWPGALVDVSLAVQSMKNVIVIPPRAVQVGPSGQFVYVVAADSTVATQPVKIDYLTSDEAVVSGLPEGSRVVIEGGQSLRPGLKVIEARDDSAVKAAIATKAQTGGAQ